MNINWHISGSCLVLLAEVGITPIELVEGRFKICILFPYHCSNGGGYHNAVDWGCLCTWCQNVCSSFYCRINQCSLQKHIENNNEIISGDFSLWGLMVYLVVFFFMALELFVPPLHVKFGAVDLVKINFISSLIFWSILDTIIIRISSLEFLHCPCINLPPMAYYCPH